MPETLPVSKPLDEVAALAACVEELEQEMAEVADRSQHGEFRRLSFGI
ncbi:hypothetical protein N9917_03205 [Deltaproteobacteria bacterium]|nr:hypothetical protein [Deltaproteobacteria bacterium]